jgi:hypothetical protein
MEGLESALDNMKMEKMMARLLVEMKDEIRTNHARRTPI